MDICFWFDCEVGCWVGGVGGGGGRGLFVEVTTDYVYIQYIQFLNRLTTDSYSCVHWDGLINIQTTSQCYLYTWFFPG